MTLNRKLISCMLLGATLIALSACSLFRKEKPPAVPEAAPEPTRVVLQLEAAGDINPGVTGRASPVVMRIYQLKSFPAFENADFIALYEKDGESLGDELVDRQEIFLKPGEKRTIYFEASDAVRTVGILTAFRSYQRGQWKAAGGLRQGKTNVIHVYLNSTSVHIE